MSNKSNDDNRSNQLNPNNDAYYSSRGIGIGRYDEDDDFEGYDSRSVIKRLCEELDDIVRTEQRIRDWETPINEEFTFDLMGMNGSRLHLKATAQLPYKKYSSHMISDCIDLIEKGLCPSLRRVFESENKTKLVYLCVRDGQGKELVWLRQEYTTQTSSFHDSSERKKEIKQQNEMWEQSTKYKVDDFKILLQDYKSLPRKDIGFVITPENYKRISIL